MLHIFNKTSKLVPAVSLCADTSYRTCLPTATLILAAICLKMSVFPYLYQKSHQTYLWETIVYCQSQKLTDRCPDGLSDGS